MSVHAFELYQGRRANDEKFIGDNHALSTPTQHGLYLMRSHLETLWAQRFERRGFTQAGYGISQPPCYFYEPRGMKRWPSYLPGKHYRIDFLLVYESSPCDLEGEQRSRATRWEWISVKPKEDAQDVEHLKALVAFDSLHQHAFQCIGDLERPLINVVTWNGSSCGVRRS